MENLIQKIYQRHDVYVNQKYGEDDLLSYSFHLKAVRAQGLKFVDLWLKLTNHEFDTRLLEVVLAGHDLIEDARMTQNDIRELIKSEMIINDKSLEMITNIIYTVTDEKGRNRSERKNQKYYQELSQNKLAIFVKLADISANTLYSKLFHTRQYRMYKSEFQAFKEKTYSEELKEFFHYVENL